jgi:hypothetical protein
LAAISPFSRFALKRIGSFIQTIDTQTTQRSCVWIKEDETILNLSRPFDIVESGRQKMKELGNWKDEQEVAYQEHVVPFMYNAS